MAASPRRYKHTIIYGLALALLLFLLKWLEWKFVVYDHAIEIYSGAIAVLFTGLGIWLALRLARPKGPAIDSRTPAEPGLHSGPGILSDPDIHSDRNGLSNLNDLPRHGLSAREQEVLQLMAEGLSNQEIAARLYVSLNTVKTHSSKVFEKLDVRRRTQAVDKARRLNIIG